MSRLRYIKDISREDVSARRIGAAVARRVREMPHRVAWELTSRGRCARERLERFRGIHAGQRGWVVANGPSLAETDLSRIGPEPTIGMNRIYRARALWGFMPDYLAVIDLDSQLKQIGGELDEIQLPKFINWNGRHWVGEGELTNFIKLTFKPRFSTDLTRGIWGGHSVTYACLQIAYFMGFEQVVLVGKDHSYREQGVPGEVKVSTGEERNHFVEGYYEKGATWRIPDYKGEELAYKMAREAFERDGREVVDATVDGKLDVFSKVNFEDLF